VERFNVDIIKKNTLGFSSLPQTETSKQTNKTPTATKGERLWGENVRTTEMYIFTDFFSVCYEK